MQQFWTNRTTFEKLCLLIIAVLLIFGIYKSIQYSVIKYKFIKNEIELKEVYKDSLADVKLQLQLKIEDSKKTNIKAKVKAVKTDDKLKQDVKEIHNTIISNDELLQFLSDTEQRAKEIRNK